jgi:uncharacterized protein
MEMNNSYYSKSNPFQRIKLRFLFLWIFAGFITSSLFVVRFLPKLLGTQVNSILQGIFVQYGIYIFIFCWIFIAFKKNQVNISQFIGVLNKKSVFAIAAVLISLLLFSYANIWITYYPISFFYPDYVEKLLNDKKLNLILSSGHYFIPFFIQFILLGPFFEEIVFRGLIIHRLAIKYGIIPAIFISSLLFSIAHLKLNIADFIIFGLILSIVYLKTRSLVASILLHCSYNLAGLLHDVISFSTNTSNNYYSVIKFRSDIWIAGICLLISMPWLISLFKRYWPKSIVTLPYFSNRL